MNIIIFIGSHKGNPVFFCDFDIILDPEELRCAGNTSLIEGIMCSSTFSERLSLYVTSVRLTLFKPREILLSPIMEKRIIFDGSHCAPRRKGKFVLDGSTPTPLVIDYLKNSPGEHNVVVFDNGGPFDAEFEINQP